MIGQQKRSLEHCLPFQPVKCMKQSEALTWKSRCETEAEDEEVLLVSQVDDGEGEHDQQLCLEDSLCPLESSKETTKDNNSSSQENSSLELCCPLQESSVSSPAPIRYYHLQVKKVPVGPEYQADVPDWDPCNRPERGCFGEGIKWCGAKLWPLEGQEKRGDAAVVGRGRREVCGCLDSGSIDCVRRHVAEERHRVKDELGPMLFDRFGFNDMGECVSEHWSEGEERTFGELVKLNPASLGRDFWSQLATAFPSRSSLELVSYYFNVFVLRRRALQNRFDPEHADSDDDETELVESEVDEDWEQHIEDDEEEVEERGGPGYHHQCIQDEDLVEDDDDEGPRWEDEEEEVADEQDQDHHLDQHQDQHHDEDHQFAGMLQDHRSTSCSFHEQHRELSSESYLKELGGGPGASSGGDWMGPVEWHHHHQASSTAASGIGALELASTHGAMQELFGEEDGGGR